MAMTIKDLKAVLDNFNDDDAVMIWDYADNMQNAVLECREGVLALADEYHYTTAEQKAMGDAYLKVNNL